MPVVFREGKEIKSILGVLLCPLFLTGCINIGISPGVSGWVRNADGEPINAVVTVTHSQLTDQEKSVETDGDGSYSMSGLRMWTQVPFSSVMLSSVVTVEADGYETQTYTAEGTETEPRSVVLERE